MGILTLIIPPFVRAAVSVCCHVLLSARSYLILLARSGGELLASLRRVSDLGILLLLHRQILLLALGCSAQRGVSDLVLLVMLLLRSRGR